MRKLLLVFVVVLISLPMMVMAQCGTNLTATDQDGEIYQSLKVGPHCWMQTNLKTKVPGSMIYRSDMYPDTTANLATFGRLYPWAVASDPNTVGEHNFVKGVCPDGWHLPLPVELQQLAANDASVVRSAEQWLVPGTNTTGFGLLPGGFYNNGTTRCENLGGEAYFWSVGSNNEPVEVWSDCHCDMILLNPGKVNNALSVRCVYKIYQAQVATYAASDVKAYQANLNGDVVFAGYDENFTKGFVYGTDMNDLSNDTAQLHQTAEGQYSFKIENLEPNTKYYYKAYVVNEFDTVYGAMGSFTTPELVVTTDSVHAVTKNSGKLYGNVTQMGGYTSLTAGFRYGQHPDYMTSKTESTVSATGPYNAELTGISPNTTYYFQAYAATATDTAWATDTLSFTTLTVPCYGTPTTNERGATNVIDSVLDNEGNAYIVVQIGNQCWMAENLRTSTAGAGNVYTPTNEQVPGYDVNIYGRLYDWAAVMQGKTSSQTAPSGVQGICPAGWHVPSAAEWDTLTSYVKSQSEYLCEGCSGTDDVAYTYCIANALAASTRWNNCEGSCTVGNNQKDNNATGFSAVPTGYYYDDKFKEFGTDASCWSATENDGNSAFYRTLQYNNNYVISYFYDKNTGFAVRCLRDSEAAPAQTDTIAFLPNGGQGAMDSIFVTRGEQKPLPAYTYTHDGNWEFIGWNTEADGSGTHYDNLATITTNGNVTLHAQWHTWCTGTPKTSVNEFGNSRIDSVKDVDNNKYAVVQIGNQCWMKQNLRTKLGTDGDNGYPKYPYGHTKAGQMVDDSLLYGRLYTWDAVTKGAFTNYPANPTDTLVHGICPAGWHVPSDAEWDTLTYYVFNSTSPDYKCGSECGSWAAQSNVSCIAKALSAATGWSSNTSEGCNAGNTGDKSNATGFSAVPAGRYLDVGSGSFGDAAYFWSATRREVPNAWTRTLTSHESHVYSYDGSLGYGFSVRCVRDSEAAPAQTDTIAFLPNGGQGAMDSIFVTRGEQKPLPAYTYTHDGNWEFIGWNTEADGSGTHYDNLATITTNGNVTLHAQWHTWCTGTPKISVNEFGTDRIDSVKDVDNNKYAVVQIGNQCWMAQNLRTTTGLTENTNYWHANGQSANDGTYGLLYKWDAVTKGASTNYPTNTTDTLVHGICPAGWHVPSDAEWDTLTNYVNSVTDYRCGGTDNAIAKALSSTTGWSSNTSSGCNAGNTGDKSNLTGFSAVPAGCRCGNDSNFGSTANFWSATQSEGNAYYRNLSFNYPDVYGIGVTKADGYSVRCVRDSEAAPAQTDTIAFLPNGGQGAMDSIFVTRGEQKPLPAYTYTHDGNWEFIGWNTEADGSGTHYDNLATITTNGNVTLHAQWHTWCTGTPKISVNEFGTDRIDSVKDVDNNKYAVVQIGNQCWMAQNLRTSTNTADTGNIYTPTTEEVPGYDVAIYGRLYDWAAVMQGASSSAATPSGVQGICPDGWHVPSTAEFDTLTNYVNSVTEYRCGETDNAIAKALASTTGWESDDENCAVGNDPSANNATGFSAVPAGYYNNGNYHGFGGDADFWSATQLNNEGAYTRSLYYYRADVDWYSIKKNYGYSVRCVRDPEAPSAMSVTTDSANTVTNNSAKLYGNVTSMGDNDKVTVGFRYGQHPNYMVFKVENTASATGSYNAELTNISPNTTYYFQAYVATATDTAWAVDTLTFITLTNPCSVVSLRVGATLDGGKFANKEYGANSKIDSVSDHEGNIYRVVQIGGQCWLAENMRATTEPGGEDILQNPADITTDATKKYAYYYDNDVANRSKYGCLYTWSAAMNGVSTNGARGICPEGWHVSTDEEWWQLEKNVLTDLTQNDSTKTGYRGTGAGKLAGGCDWNGMDILITPNSYSNADRNSTGFSVLPAGGYTKSFNHAGDGAYFWSATSLTNSYASSRTMYTSNEGVFLANNYKYYGRSVRCVRDPEYAVITFQPNGAMGTMENQTVLSGVTTPLNANTFNRSTAPENDRNWEFIGWNTKADGTGNSFADQADVTFDSDTTLYAQWHTYCAGTPKTSVYEFGDSRIDSVKDVDNNKYTVVQIGNQCWLKENLRTTTKSKGNIYTPTTTQVPGYDVNTYGRLYDWDAVMQGASSSTTAPSGVQGICPEGWHVPSNAEFDTLKNYVSSQSSYFCGNNSSNIAKALASIMGWDGSSYDCVVGNNPSANNATGFSAVPSGAYYVYAKVYTAFGNDAAFWLATKDNDPDDSYYAYLTVSEAAVDRYTYNKGCGFSIRCLRDPEQMDTITFQPNGGMGTMEKQTVHRGIATPLRANTFNRTTAPEKDRNWEFIGWNTKADGTGVSYTDQANVTFSNNTTLYAQWHTWCTGNKRDNEFGTSHIDSVKDVENNKYTVVQIGNQCWMKENMRTTKYDDDTSIPLGSSMGTITACRYYPNNDANNVSTYGYLYNWKAAMGKSFASSDVPSGVQGICPSGWHVPSEAEFDTLKNYVSSQSQYLCGSNSMYIAKALASITEVWKLNDDWSCAVGNNMVANNATGFSALPAGDYEENYADHYYYFGEDAEFWSTTQITGSFYVEARTRYISYSSLDLGKNNYDTTSYAFSVRCVRDPEQTVTVSFHPNGAMGTMESQTVIGGVSTQINENTFNRNNAPEKDRNWEFIGWNTKSDGTGTHYDNKGTIATNGNLTLYAQWHTYCAGMPNTSQNEFGTSRIDSVQDVDNNKYSVVQIGNQCWLKQNLRTNVGGGVYPKYPTGHARADQMVDDSLLYGRLYSWTAMMNNTASSNDVPSGVRGICPEGWHVPSSAEFDTLFTYAKSKAEYRCGSENIANALTFGTWDASRIACTAGDVAATSFNKTGFSAVPAGSYAISSFNYFGAKTLFWGATQQEERSFFWDLNSDNSDVFTSFIYPNFGYGFSVRCLRNA